MKTADVRSAFLTFFKDRGHTIVPSDSLIPSSDPTLLFTSAGMVQFKPNFQNPESSPYPRAASCQKCLRTSDIERVGSTLRHLTFFEMLGNFSFGDYFKQEAVAWAWEFFTKTMGLPADRFIATVYKTDDEAFALWEKLIPKNRIVRLGDETNFWTMGPTGPCGPCSEILWDRGAEWSCGKPTCGPDCDCDRYLEVWNLVFTQFDRDASGKLKALPRKNIDTGMGLERISLLMQGASSPFGTDGFQTVFKRLADISGRPIPADVRPSGAPEPQVVAFRRIADHSRAITFMINDGILPSNEGRGYVLRRLLRQAVRAGKTLGLSEPFVYRLTGDVIDTMKTAYPDILPRRETIFSVVKMEEQKFLETLDTGTRLLEDMAASAKKNKITVLPGKEVFQLYDTFGFPFELTKEMAEGLGLKVDTEGYKKAQEQAADLARKAWKGSGAQEVDHYRVWKTKIPAATPFRGYDTLLVETKVLAPMYGYHGGTPSPQPSPRGEGNGKEVPSPPGRGIKGEGETWTAVDILHAGEEGEVVLAETPFYSEGGGQVGDVGWLEFSGGQAEVLDTQTPVDGLAVHRVRIVQGTLSGGAKVTATVDRLKREATMRHHTATHLLHKALKQVLGPHVTQAGSLVAPDRLRFDFNHNAPLTPEQRRSVEDLVNEQIFKDTPVRPHQISKQEAQMVGAVMLFGEKYGEHVRAIMVSGDDWSHAKDAWSLELCGGTHVSATGQIGFFKIISQSSVSAGVRRLEAVCGFQAVSAVRHMEQQLSKLADALKTTPDELGPRVDKLLNQEKQLEREIQSLKSGSLKSQFDDLAKSAKTAAGISFVSQQLAGVQAKELREMSDRLKANASIGVVVLATVEDEKISFVVSVQKDLAARGLHAGTLSKELAALIQGSGGGRPDFAQGGGRDIQALAGALDQVDGMINRLLQP